MVKFSLLKTIFSNSVFLLLFTFSANTVFAQKSLFRIAVELSESRYEEGTDESAYKFRFDNSDSSVLLKLAAFLEIEATNSSEIQVQVCEALEENPFFSCSNMKKAPIHIPEELSSPMATRKDLNDFQDQYHSLSAPSVPNTSSIFTTAVDGFSRWLVKRTKQELSLVFFDKFKAALNEQDYLNTLFPTTVGLLNVVDSDGYNNGYLRSLQESFYMDFQQLPYQMPEWASTTNLIDDEDERFLISEIMKIVPTVLDGNTPDVIFDQLTSVNSVPDKYADVFASFKLSKIISNSLKNGRDSWEPINYWEENIKKDFVFYAYMGLLWHKGHQLNFQNEKIKNSFSNLGSKLVSDKFGMQKDSVKNVVKNFLNYSKKTAQLVQDFRNRKVLNDTISTANREFQAYSNTVIELMKASDEFRIYLIGGKPSESFATTVSLLKDANQMLYNISENRYMLSVANLNSIFEKVYTISRPDISSEAIEETYGEFKDNYFKYVTFMATVADARNAREVEYAFDMFALPAGSSRLKKNSKFSLGINAYVGPTVGREFLEIAEDETVVALAAPVGLSINRGYGKTGSFTFFVPIIDLGAVTAFRFGDQASKLPELNFNNIIAPGFYGIYGFGKDLPLALGAGVQLGPNLRKITRDVGGTAAEINDRGWRYGIFMAVDIPVFHFYTK